MENESPSVERPPGGTARPEWGGLVATLSLIRPALASWPQRALWFEVANG